MAFYWLLVKHMNEQKHFPAKLEWWYYMTQTCHPLHFIAAWPPWLAMGVWPPPITTTYLLRVEWAVQPQWAANEEKEEQRRNEQKDTIGPSESSFTNIVLYFEFVRVYKNVVISVVIFVAFQNLVHEQAQPFCWSACGHVNLDSYLKKDLVFRFQQAIVLLGMCATVCVVYMYPFLTQKLFMFWPR